MKKMHARLAGWGMALVVSGCALGPDFVPPQPTTPVWQAPLPHGGKVENLTQWWAQFNDPVLNQLISEAEQSSPSLDQAWARVQEARANQSASSGAYLPAVGASVAATQSQSVFGQQVIRQNIKRAGFDAGWELDLLGKTRRTVESADAMLNAMGAQWHAARISLAAEVADVYMETRQCEATLDIYQQIQQSKTATLNMVQRKQAAGLAADVETARSVAAQAESASALAAKQGECARSLNKLTALTGVTRTVLQSRLSAQHGVLPVPNQVDVSEVAANALHQRPDVAAAAANWAAASADIGVAKAGLFPSLSLNGSIGNSRVNMGGLNLSATTWSFGPVLNIPLFDGNRRKGALAGARARFDYAEASYRRSVREAVREIEDSLTRLEVANQRITAARTAQNQLNSVYQSTQQCQQAGLANGLELEDARRGALQTDEAVAALQRESIAAWIALYKALGGGWDGQAVPVRRL